MFRNAGYAFIGLFGLAVLAFWPPYLGKLAQGGISPYVHLHAILMVLWLGLLITQPFLLRSGRRKLHRRLGAVSYGLAPVIVIAGVLLAHAGLRRDAADDFVAAGTSLYLPLSMITLFAVAYALAIAYRKSSPLHARFMIATSLAVVDPIVARVAFFYLPRLPSTLYYPLVSFILSALVLLALMYAERRQRRGRVAFPAMLGATALVYGLWFTLAQSHAWLGFARWFGELPLT